MKLPPMPQLTKRGVAVLSITGTASVFLTLGAIIKPAPVQAPPAATQIIVVVVPVAPAVLTPAPRAPAQGISL